MTKTTITPDKDNLRNEISRRVTLINKREERDNLPSEKMTKVPKNKNWGKPKLVEWLRNNPLLGVEKAWVVRKIVSLAKLLEEEGAKKEPEKEKKVSWFKKIFGD